MITGIDIIDEQHELIKSCTKKLEDVIIKRDKSVYNPKEILNILYKYYKTHFYTEELYLKKMDMNDEHIQEHIQEHMDFLKLLKNIGNADKISVELILNLKKWTESHIMEMDMNDFKEPLT